MVRSCSISEVVCTTCNPQFVIAVFASHAIYNLLPQCSHHMLSTICYRSVCIACNHHIVAALSFHKIHRQQRSCVDLSGRQTMFVLLLPTHFVAFASRAFAFHVHQFAQSAALAVDSIITHAFGCRIVISQDTPSTEIMC